MKWTKERKISSQDCKGRNNEENCKTYFEISMLLMNDRLEDEHNKKRNRKNESIGRKRRKQDGKMQKCCQMIKQYGKKCKRKPRKVIL